MVKEIWFAKAHTLQDGGSVLYCKAIPVIKETPKMWHLDVSDSNDHALAGFVRSVRKTTNSFGYSKSRITFYAQDKFAVISLLISQLENKVKDTEKDAKAAVKELAAARDLLAD